MLVVEGMEVGGGYVLLGKCPDGGQSLQCGGDVGIHWTASYRGDGALSVSNRQRGRQTDRQTSRQMSHPSTATSFLHISFSVLRS